MRFWRSTGHLFQERWLGFSCIVFSRVCEEYKHPADSTNLGLVYAISCSSLSLWLLCKQHLNHRNLRVDLRRGRCWLVFSPSQNSEFWHNVCDWKCVQNQKWMMAGSNPLLVFSWTIKDVMTFLSLVLIYITTRESGWEWEQENEIVVPIPPQLVPAGQQNLKIVLIVPSSLWKRVQNGYALIFWDLSPVD